MRIKRGIITRKKIKKCIKFAKHYHLATFYLRIKLLEQLPQSLKFQTMSRKLKKRHQKMLWISSIKILCFTQLVKYSAIIKSFKINNVFLNKKFAAWLLYYDPFVTNILITLYNQEIS
jgi:ribosomal protein L20